MLQTDIRHRVSKLGRVWVRACFGLKIFKKFKHNSGLIQALCFEERLHWTRSNAKQPKFDVIANLQKVSTGRELRERLLNFA